MARWQLRRALLEGHETAAAAAMMCEAFEVFAPNVLQFTDRYAIVPVYKAKKLKEW